MLTIHGYPHSLHCHMYPIAHNILMSGTEKVIILMSDLFRGIDTNRQT